MFRYALKRPPPPLTDKDELLNRLKLAANFVQVGDPESRTAAIAVLDELVETVESEEFQVNSRNLTSS